MFLLSVCILFLPHPHPLSAHILQLSGEVIATPLTRSQHDEAMKVSPLRQKDQSSVSAQQCINHLSKLILYAPPKISKHFEYFYFLFVFQETMGEIYLGVFQPTNFYFTSLCCSALHSAFSLHPLSYFPTFLPPAKNLNPSLPPIPSPSLPSLHPPSSTLSHHPHRCWPVASRTTRLALPPIFALCLRALSLIACAAAAVQVCVRQMVSRVPLKKKEIIFILFLSFLKIVVCFGSILFFIILV
jgi:hypothetical protein